MSFKVIHSKKRDVVRPHPTCTITLGRFALLIAPGLHHIELKDTPLNDTKVSPPRSLPYVLEKEQQVQSAQFKASVLI